MSLTLAPVTRQDSLHLALLHKKFKLLKVASKHAIAFYCAKWRPRTLFKLALRNCGETLTVDQYNSSISNSMKVESIVRKYFPELLKSMLQTTSKSYWSFSRKKPLKHIYPTPFLSSTDFLETGNRQFFLNNTAFFSPLRNRVLKAPLKLRQSFLSWLL